jgi:hypothetical protein
MIRHPSLPLLSGTFSREDFFLVVYCVVDDWMHARFASANAPRARRRSGDAEFPDAEVLIVSSPRANGRLAQALFNLTP